MEQIILKTPEGDKEVKHYFFLWKHASNQIHIHNLYPENIKEFTSMFKRGTKFSQPYSEDVLVVTKTHVIDCDKSGDIFELHLTYAHADEFEERRNLGTVQNFNFNGGVSQSNIGNYNTLNVTIENSLSELSTLIENLKDNDKIVGESLLSTLNTQEPKKGFLSKFNQFLGDYPHIRNSVSSVLIAIALSQSGN